MNILDRVTREECTGVRQPRLTNGRRKRWSNGVQVSREKKVSTRGTPGTSTNLHTGDEIRSLPHVSDKVTSKDYDEV